MVCSTSAVNSLSRENTEIIQAEGRRPVTRVLDEASYRQALLAKLMEEAQKASHATLFIAETTVKTHIARLLMKPSLRDQVQIVVFASPFRSPVPISGQNGRQPFASGSRKSSTPS